MPRIMQWGLLAWLLAGLAFMLPGFIFMLALSILYVETDLAHRLDDLFYGMRSRSPPRARSSRRSLQP